MSDAEWTLVRDLLPVPGRPAGRGGRPEGYCHRQMIDAVRCLVDNGIKWRARPRTSSPGLSQRTADSDPPYIAYFDEVELAAEIGHCFRDLGRSVEAAERGTGSVFGDGMNNRSDFFATMVQAEAYLNQGEIGRGFEIAVGALSLGEGLKSARCVQYVREVSRVQPSDLGRLGWMSTCR